MIKRLGTKKERTAVLFFFFTNVLIQLTIWLERNYDQISFDQFLFTLKSTSHGVHAALLGSGLLQIGLLPVLLTAFGIWLYRLPHPALAEELQKQSGFYDAELLQIEE